METNETRPFGMRYRIEGVIGEGGMGRVYRVFDTIREEIVALKQLGDAHHASRAARIRFENEFRLMAKFQHPHTLRVHDFGFTADHVPFFTMEYVKGQSISKLKPLTIAQVATHIGQVCLGLSHIHSRLYVHRDLKPSNIKVREDGTVKLLDYGLMSQLGVRGSKTVAGSFAYMAPEALTGGVIDGATDLYSVGILAYELLTGVRPFSGGRQDLVSAHLSEKPRPPSELRADVPPSLDKIVLKLLAKHPSERYQSAAEVVTDLKHLAPADALVSTVEQRQAYLYSTELIGRDAELALVRHGLHHLHSNKSTALFFGAPAGVGKSRLLQEIKTRCNIEGRPTLWVDEHGGEDRIFGWIDELARQLWTLSNADERQEFAFPLAPTLPSLRPFNGDWEKTSKLSEAELARKVRSWVRKVSKRTPLVLLLDNLQWMDLKSVTVLNELIRRHRDNRLMIVGTYRSDETSKTSPLFHTRDEELATFAELAPLSRQECRRLLDHLLRPTRVSEDFAQRLFGLSGGNVFQMVEALRFLLTEGRLTLSGDHWVEPVDLNERTLPENSEERIRRRYDRLGADARKLAEAAAVLGVDLDVGIWRDVSGLSADDFYSGLEELVTAQLIVQEDADYFFGHAKLRDGIYQAMEQGQQRTLHGSVADSLAALGDEDRELVPVIARHFVAANRTHAAIEYSMRAAQQMEDAGAEWSAFDHYRDAARLLEEQSGYPDRAKVLLQIYEKAAAFNSAAWTDAACCLRWLQAAIDHYVDKEDQDKVFGLSLAYVVNSCITSNYKTARDKAEHMVASKMVEKGSIPWAILHGAAICLIDWYQGFQADCLAHAEEAVAIFSQHEADLDTGTWMAYSWANFWREKARAYTGQPLEMDKIELNQRRIAEGRCDETIFWHTLTAVGARAAYTGRWRDLLAWKDRASKLSRKMGKIYWFECWISHSYLYGAIQHGELEPLDQHIAQVAASPDPYQVRLASLFAGVLALERGQLPQAKDALEQFLRLEEDSPDNSLLEGHFYLASTLIAMGELDKARRHLAIGKELAHSGPYQNPLYQLQYARLEIELLLASGPLGDDALVDACASLERAAELAHQAKNPLQAGYLQFTLAKVELARKNDQRALGRLQMARELFATLQNHYRVAKVETLIDSLSLHARQTSKGAEAEELGAVPPHFDETEAPTVLLDASDLSSASASALRSQTNPSHVSCDDDTVMT